MDKLQPEKRGFWWIPRMSHPHRGYTREEARAAVGAGWAELATEAWDLVNSHGGRVTQLKQKHRLLTVYFDGVDSARGTSWSGNWTNWRRGVAVCAKGAAHPAVRSAASVAAHRSCR